MSTYTQFFPPAPTFTEASLIDLSQKVYIITGATSGIGLSLATILYNLHATVYLGSRSDSSFATASSTIKESCPNSKGSLKPFVANLSSLSTIKPAVEAFLNEEHRLDVLFLNAGVMTPPAGSKTDDGYDMEIGTNCLAGLLLTRLLTPIMTTTSSHFCHPNTSIRVVWVSSLLSLSTPKGGVQLTAAGAPTQMSGMANYMQSKAGDYLLAHESTLRQHQPASTSTSASSPSLPSQNPAGVLHIPLHPGFLNTSLQRHAPAPMRGIMSRVFKGPKYGAYTELYAGLAPGVKNGDFIIPWGRKGTCMPEHIVASTKATKEGEKSVSARFYEWCEEQVRPFM